MQVTGGLINDILILALFFILSLLVSGKIRMRQERQEKFNALMQRRGKLLKILSYGGTIIFALLILINIFEFKNRQRKTTSNLREQHRQWTKADKNAMTEACIVNAKNSNKKDPKGTAAFCECVTEIFTSEYTYDQAQELNKKSQQEQFDSIMPIVNKCKNDTASEK